MAYCDYQTSKTDLIKQKYALHVSVTELWNEERQP